MAQLLNPCDQFSILPGIFFKDIGAGSLSQTNKNPNEGYAFHSRTLRSTSGNRCKFRYVHCLKFAGSQTQQKGRENLFLEIRSQLKVAN